MRASTETLGSPHYGGDLRRGHVRGALEDEVFEAVRLCLQALGQESPPVAGNCGLPGKVDDGKVLSCGLLTIPIQSLLGKQASL